MAETFLPPNEPAGTSFDVTLGPCGYAFFKLAFEHNGLEGETEVEFFRRIFFTACIQDRKQVIGVQQQDDLDAAVAVLQADLNDDSATMSAEAATALADTIGGM